MSDKEGLRPQSQKGNGPEEENGRPAPNITIETTGSNCVFASFERAFRAISNGQDIRFECGKCALSLIVPEDTVDLVLLGLPPKYDDSLTEEPCPIFYASIKAQNPDVN